KAWSQEAKNLVKTLINPAGRLTDFLIIPQRTYQLYRAWEDFTTLQAEAQTLAQKEIDEVLGVNHFAGAQ
ncbi:23749_t:CDS:2, partial [Gigaspora margarita]